MLMMPMPMSANSSHDCHGRWGGSALVLYDDDTADVTVVQPNEACNFVGPVFLSNYRCHMMSYCLPLYLSLSLCPTTARMDHTGGRCLPETVSIFQLQRWQGQEQVTSCDEVVRNKMHRTREMRRMEAAAKWAKKDGVEMGYCCCGNAF